jgi:predicted molibdopterin-dependent oxidoreductase YjgC
VNKELEEVGWEEALDFVAQRLKKFKGKDIGLISSPQASCEESFLFRKFAREALKTENSDSPAHFSPLATYMEMAQVNDLKPNLNFRIKDISEAKVLFLVGSEIAVSHPMIWLEVLKAVRAGAKLIVASSIESFLNRYSSLYLQIKPGSEFYLFSFLCKAFLEKEQAEDISKNDSFEPFKKSLEKIHSSQVFELTGVREEDLKEASEFLFKEESSVFLFGSGMTQSPFGSQSVSALWNLASLTEAKLFPLGLENNLRGELGIGEIFSRKGLTFDQIIGAASSGEIKALYLAGPVPELKKAKMEFLVLQDSFKSENIKMADAVLPAATFAETDGTFINNEGRIQKFGRVVKPVGEAKPDWWIISRLAQKMGKKGFDFRTPSGIMEEMRKASPSLFNASYPEQQKNKAAFIGEEENKEKKFLPLTFGRFSVETSKTYPFLLCIDYNLDFYRNLSLSQEIRGLKILRDSRWIKMNSEDAERLELKDG